jgi:hypothetical protein
LVDLQRVVSALENKIDANSFDNLVRAVDSKVDREELNATREEYKS